MTSDTKLEEVYVWIWLPGSTEPIVAGLLQRDGARLVFNYGRSYLANPRAIPIYEPELPMRAGVLPLPNGLGMPSSIRDAAPDAWGRRVIVNRRLGHKGAAIDLAQLDELDYLVESGSDRAGALDFQLSAKTYVPRHGLGASLVDLSKMASGVEVGKPIAADLEQALYHGSSLGGARPKALVEDDATKSIAKFSSQSDIFNVVKGELVAMQLAARVGLNVAATRLTHAAGKDVLLIDRFDREKTALGWQRKAMVSALTLFGLDEMMARYASYEDLAEIVRHRFVEPRATLRELFGRVVFNILCGNTDDHARNHAAFWDGHSLMLTPAYDICPQNRSGGEASQAMLISGDRRESRLEVCLDAAKHFQLTAADAVDVVEGQITTICGAWRSVCDMAELSEVDRLLLWRRQLLNPFAFQGAPSHLADLVRLPR